jgi:hypothetical protein
MWGMSVAKGEVAIRLTSVGDPQSLTVGQTVQFQVQLSGLESGQELDFLAATVH